MPTTPLPETASAAPRAGAPAGRNRHWRRWLWRAALAMAAAYATVIVYLIVNETELIFRNGRPLGAARPAPPAQLVEYSTDGSSGQPAWRAPASIAPSRAPWVLYLHGNDANIGTRLNVAHYDRLRSLGLNVFAPEYRGFAGTRGTPTESSLAADARASWNYLRGVEQVPAGRIIIYGWSLGSAVAVTLASQVDEAAVILEGAPASVAAVGALAYPYVPVRAVIRNPFDSIDRIGRIGSPVLFLHSPEDTVIPIGEGRRLFEAAQPPRTFVEVRGGHVYASEVDREAFYGAVNTFLRSHDLLPGSAVAAP